MSSHDPRLIATGRDIPTGSYCDQPYIVKTDDLAWLCCVTTGVGREGQPGQIVTTLRSTDRGANWSAPLPVEPPEGPEASYAVMLKVPTGRVYIFYNHNTDDIREIPADPVPGFPGGVCRRVDSLGQYVLKFSDDHGRSWSAERYPVPVREFEIDRRNRSGGAIRYFWNVGKPFIHEGVAYVSLHKVGGFGEGFFTSSEGVLLASPNLATEQDPRRIVWETLPEGEVGLRAPAGGGPIAEEQSYVVLSDGSFYATYRTIDGYPAEAYSRDRGRSWSAPAYRRYADGRLMKHPRAATFVWKCANGRYLCWFHNHGGRFIAEHPRRRTMAYDDRNPVWLCGGVEADGPQGRIIAWSQPEIVLYDDDPHVRMSYPDLVEQDGCTYLTETQKNKARVHEIDPNLLAGLWSQRTIGAVSRDGLILELVRPADGMPAEVPAPELPELTRRDAGRADYGTLDLRAGLTVELWLQLDSLAAGQLVVDNRDSGGRGLCVLTAEGGAAGIVLHDGQSESRWDCGPGMLSEGRLQHVAVIVDGGPKIITFVVDGALCDGGEHRQFGWGRYNPHQRGLAGGWALRIAPRMRGRLAALRLYARALRTSEVVASYRAGAEARAREA